ncbi:hypothetical protein B0T09DRAFT_60075 [Sordaria sp. MPI-SDFR-AT-0083]|nr:hypothetical protein B0T09DRAFT_60075 [Sordaria sp. MPI-SDFR-AT-0083]
MMMCHRSTVSHTRIRTWKCFAVSTPWRLIISYANTVCLLRAWLNLDAGTSRGITLQHGLDLDLWMPFRFIFTPLLLPVPSLWLLNPVFLLLLLLVASPPVASLYATSCSPVRIPVRRELNRQIAFPEQTVPNSVGPSHSLKTSIIPPRSV